MKHAKKSKFGVKHLLLIVSLILILAVGTTATLAFLADSESLTNTFTPAHVTCEVTETVNGTEDPNDSRIHTGVTSKTNVAVKNTSDTVAYIRAAVVINWVDANGNVVAPANSGEYTISMPTNTGWFKEGNYYYYTQPVDSLQSTGVLISSASGTKSGCHLQVDILAEAIQATPKKAVEEAWGKTVADQLTNVSEGGSN